MKAQPNLDELSAEQVRALAAQLLVKVEQDAQTIRYQQALNDKLTHELAILKRHQFAKRSEALSANQSSLLDEHIDGDIGAIEEELARAGEQVAGTLKQKRQPKRTPLPPELPRTIIQHEPGQTTCGCGCALTRIGEDVSEKLDYQPGSFTVERHVRGKWVCDHCETLVQAPVPAQVIDKGIPASGLLAHVLVAKYADHLPLYRQEKIFDRAGLAIARSTGRLGGALWCCFATVSGGLARDASRTPCTACG